MGDGAKPFGPDALRLVSAFDGVEIGSFDSAMAAAAAAHLSDVLDSVQGELDRLRVIVDLACAVHEALVSGDRAAWRDATDAQRAAIRAEVTRRAAL